MSSETKLADEINFARNPEPRCPCILLLDTSGSMQGDRIEALNAGLAAFKNDIMKDRLACKRVEIAIVTFDTQVRIVQDFVTVDKLVPPQLVASGLTHMGQGISQALDLIDVRKQTYRANGVSYYRPWVFMITDGKPEGEGEETSANEAAIRLHTSEAKRRLTFFAVGVAGADMTRLAQIAPPNRGPKKLEGLNFGELFLWLSASMQAVSHSGTDDDEVQVALPPVGWESVAR